MKKTKPLIFIVYCGKAWVLNRMASLIASVLRSKFDVITCYSGALAKEYGGNPEYIKSLPIDGYCNLVAVDNHMGQILNGHEAIVSTVHHWVSDEMYNSLYPTFRNSDFIVTDSEEWGEKLKAKGVKIPTETIHPFVDQRFFNTKAKSKNKDGKIAVGTFSMVHGNQEDDRKGTRHLVALAKHINERHMQDKIKFVISGGGWEDIIKQINSYGIGVEYQPSLDDSEMPKMYRALDFYLVLSDIEGGPFSVMEAMASNVMVVSTNVGVVRDIGVDGENIAIVDNKNSKQILDTILRYHGNRSEYDRIIKNGYAVAENHTPEKVYSKYIEIFDRLIDRTKVAYDDSLDLDEVQKYCETFGCAIIEKRKIKSSVPKFFKPLLRLMKNIVPVKSWKIKIKRLYE